MDTSKPNLPKKRWTRREDIIKAIDRFTAKADAQHQKAVTLMEAAESIKARSRKPAFVKDYLAMIRESSNMEYDAEKLIKKAGRIREKKLPLLKRKLAEFDTEVLSIVTDKSVESI